MQKLVKGIHQFQTHVFREKRDLFRNLATGQRPGALFITCSDSRINPNLLTQTEPGELFIVRNAGNLIPPSPSQGGEIATIEFAVVALGIQDIVICGHSDCGAMKGVIDPCGIEKAMPSLYHWLGNARRTGDIIDAEYRHLEGRELLTATVEENVLVQIENLRTHDFIEQRLARGELNLHGWVYKFETGEVFGYDPEPGQFLPVTPEISPKPTYPRDAALAGSPRNRRTREV